MCPDCGQPMLPKGVKKQPNEYDHASGCPQERFYIQNRGYCGNCLQWWRADRHGYTMDLREALKVGRKEAESIVSDRPGIDRMWPAADIDAIAELHVNCERLKGDNDAI